LRLTPIFKYISCGILIVRKMKSPEKDNKLPLQIYKNSYASQACYWFSIGLQLTFNWYLWDYIWYHLHVFFNIWLDYISYLILPMLLYMHKLLTHICYLCIREVDLISIIDKSFMMANLICFLHAFNVFLFDGWCQRGEIVGTKAMKCYQTPNTTDLKFWSFKWFWLFGLK
jgi:hypothetical protein